MSNEQRALAFIKAGKALQRLEEIVQAPKTESRFIIDATIQRFEFSIELMWLLLKRVLESQLVITRTPKESLQEAYKAEFIDDETMWLNMLKDRNQASYTYNQDLADEIFERIKMYQPILQKTYNRLYKEFGS